MSHEEHALPEVCLAAADEQLVDVEMYEEDEFQASFSSAVRVVAAETLVSFLCGLAHWF